MMIVRVIIVSSLTTTRSSDQRTTGYLEFHRVMAFLQRYVHLGTSGPLDIGLIDHND
jgi:hypothetical protein